MTRAFVGLGSNQGDSRRLLGRAWAALGGLPQTAVVRRSHVYRTAPVGDPDQPDFLNAIVEIETVLEPLTLLRGMQRIEIELGRTRDPDRRWGPRTIDLDLILFGHAVVREQDLTVPHPRMGERAFVLEPLAELAPDLEIPGLGRLSELRARLDASGVRVLRPESTDPGAGR
ncbi:MAG: 2-amino-4-hydroxy-6-hydroxymethyldihydropteridine diphosphokinase [Wenzhouxiangellaceae bacterium]|nr:2-amino-4-hydroxy-6-hydroxymethyldihydropteridine diphosphokinase [Wenzhouxiangellaceae bacterium]